MPRNRRRTHITHKTRTHAHIHSTNTVSPATAVSLQLILAILNESHLVVYLLRWAVYIYMLCGIESFGMAWHTTEYVVFVQVYSSPASETTRHNNSNNSGNNGRENKLRYITKRNSFISTTARLLARKYLKNTLASFFLLFLIHMWYSPYDLLTNFIFFFIRRWPMSLLILHFISLLSVSIWLICCCCTCSTSGVSLDCAYMTEQ